LALGFSFFTIAAAARALEPATGDGWRVTAIYHDYQPAELFDLSGILATVNFTHEEKTAATIETPDDKTFASVNRLALASSDDWAPGVARLSERRSV
jgi:hypothetical protein